jgi:hypothetical protein
LLLVYHEDQKIEFRGFVQKPEEIQNEIKFLKERLVTLEESRTVVKANNPPEANFKTLTKLREDDHEMDQEI